MLLLYSKMDEPGAWEVSDSMTPLRLKVVIIWTRITRSKTGMFRDHMYKIRSLRKIHVLKRIPVFWMRFHHVRTW